MGTGRGCGGHTRRERNVADSGGVMLPKMSRRHERG
jgi:hypothetical protein